MTRTSAVGLGVSRDKNRRGKQYRCRLFHHRGLLDLGRWVARGWGVALRQLRAPACQPGRDGHTEYHGDAPVCMLTGNEGVLTKREI